MTRQRRRLIGHLGSSSDSPPTGAPPVSSASKRENDTWHHKRYNGLKEKGTGFSIRERANCQERNETELSPRSLTCHYMSFCSFFSATWNSHFLEWVGVGAEIEGPALFLYLLRPNCLGVARLGKGLFEAC